MDVTGAVRRLDLNLLIPLNALLEQRHVTRAAETVGIGQSAMSAALARLRRVFDDPLLVRNGRVHELTALGQALVEPVNAVLVAAEQMLATKPHFDCSVDERTFTVVASDYVTLVLLRPLLERLYVEAPRVTVNVVPVGGSTETELERAQADLVIMPSELTSGVHDFPSRTLFTDRYVAAVWNQHREVTDRLTREQLETLRYVRYNPASDGPAFVDAQLAQLGVSPNVALSTLSFTLVPWLLPGTSLFAFVHERLVRSTPVRHELRILEPPVPLRPLTETMYWHPVLHNDPAHHWLRQCVATLAASL
ncbi:LysR family transcriptional regulator [Streptomyces sp. NBC_00878]|uniref:LysR family transcriptional regulator n=1 Tax=Streptomyces sp. NBC_00878 TaxID=2975854 RepID=UPI00224D57BA|nr:LysR family transcriptional regulator [Streptomyces sp. NBC_00878]MCX4903832.1 LysR family transcriptional regulator [Streptomyces sp. NBC_00878]